MKRLLISTAAAMCFVSGNAHAFFFFFIPGSVTNKIADSITGAEGENCVTSSAKVGDRIRLPNGDIKVVKSLSGTSIRCTNLEMPIRALLDVNVAPLPTFQSKAGIDLPDGWEAKPPTDAQRAVGIFFHAINRTTDTGLFVSAASHAPISDMASFAKARRGSQFSALDSAEATEPEVIEVAGIPAWRYSVTGNTRTKTPLRLTYLTTVFDAGNEIVVLSTWTSAANFSAQKTFLEQLTASVTGLQPTSEPLLTNSDIGKSVVPLSVGQPVVTQAAVSAPPPAQNVANELVSQKLRTLNDLYKDGVINKQDFEAKKAELLRAM